MRWLWRPSSTRAKRPPTPPTRAVRFRHPKVGTRAAASEWYRSERFEAVKSGSTRLVRGAGSPIRILLRQVGRDAEAQEVIAIAGHIPITEGRAAQAGCVVPAAAAKDADGASGRPGRILLGRLGVVVLAEPVAAPFPNIAVHVEQPERIRLKRADGGGEDVAVAAADARPGGEFVPRGRVGHVGDGHQALGIVAVIIERGAAGAARILPFRFARQPIGDLLLAAPPLAKGDGVV